MINKIKDIIEKLMCKHNYKMIEGTCHMIHGGMSKAATFKCSKCGTKIYSDIFAKGVNK